MKNKQYIIPVIIITLLTASLFMPWYHVNYEMDLSGPISASATNYLDHMEIVTQAGDYKETTSANYGDELIAPEYVEAFSPLTPLCIGAIITSLFVIIFVYKKVEKSMVIFSGFTAAITLTTIIYFVAKLDFLFTDVKEYGAGFISNVKFNDVVYVTRPGFGWIFVAVSSALSVVLICQYIKNSKKSVVGSVEIKKVE